MNIDEIIKDLVEIAQKEKPNYELLFRDAFKRGFVKGMRAENKRILEVITNKD